MTAPRSTIGSTRRFGLLGAAASLALLVVAGRPAPAHGYERATVDGKPGVYLYWSKRNIEFFVNKRGAEDAALSETLGAIRRSFFQWSGQSCTDVYFSYGGLTTNESTNLTAPNDKPDGQNTIIWRDKAWPPAGAQDGSVTKDQAALTVLIYNAETGEIVDADIDINGFHFFWTTTDDKTQVATDVQNVVTHEVGHVLGFAHTSDVEATMHGQTPQGELKKRDLAKDDLDGLCAVYPFQKSTPLGPDQPPPKPDVQGASGCVIAPALTSASRATLLPQLLVVLAALAALLAGARACRG